MLIDGFTDDAQDLAWLFVQCHFEVSPGGVGHDEPSEVEPGRQAAVPRFFPGIFFKLPGLAEVAEESADPEPVGNYQKMGDIRWRRSGKVILGRSKHGGAENLSTRETNQIKKLRAYAVDNTLFRFGQFRKRPHWSQHWAPSYTLLLKLAKW